MDAATARSMTGWHDVLGCNQYNVLMLARFFIRFAGLHAAIKSKAYQPHCATSPATLGQFSRGKPVFQGQAGNE